MSHEHVIPEVDKILNPKCPGVSKTKIAPLEYKPAEPIVVMYKDNSRAVSCGYLSPEGGCMSVHQRKALPPCIYLFPLQSKPFDQQGANPREKPPTIIEESLDYLRANEGTRITYLELGLAVWDRITPRSTIENTVSKARKLLGPNEKITTIERKRILYTSNKEKPSVI